MRENEWKEWKVRSEGAAPGPLSMGLPCERVAGRRQAERVPAAYPTASASARDRHSWVEVKPYFESTAVLRFVSRV